MSKRSAAAGVAQYRHGGGGGGTSALCSMHFVNAQVVSGCRCGPVPTWGGGELVHVTCIL